MSKYIARWKDGFSVIWRNLTWAEYRAYKTKLDNSPFLEPMDVAMDIYKTVLIEGPDLRYVPAGIPAFICKQQMVNNPFSGQFEDVSSALELARKAVTSDYLLAAKAIIASTLHYRPEEIDAWDPNLFFIRLAQAELTAGQFDPVNPKAAQAQQKGKQKTPARPLSASQQKALQRTRDRDRGM